MRQIGYVSIYSTIQKVYRDLGINDIPESDAIEWVAEAVEHLSVKENYVINTAFLDVNNYHCELPPNTVKVLQIAKHGACEHRPRFPHAIVMEVENDRCGCNTMKMECGCSTKTISNPHLMFCQSFIRNFGLVFNANRFGCHKSSWFEVEPSGNNFFSMDACDKHHNGEGLQYRISNGNILFSFEKGFVAVSYVTMALDDEGFPMIPDDVSAREAVSKYLMMKTMAREWYRGREGYQDKMMKAEQDWQWYCKQYKSKMAMPEEDDYRKLMRQELRLFPVFTPDHFGSISADFMALNADVLDEYVHPLAYNGDAIVFLPKGDFPLTGYANKLYVATDENEIYRWNNFQYVKLNGVTIDDLNALITEINGGGQ